MFNKPRRIAIIGGTFDPIHYGHLAAAEAVRFELEADEVIFVPAGKPPHKDIENISEGSHRLEMTRLATAGNDKFSVSDIEILKTETTYTIDTIKEFTRLMPDCEFIFIIGADTVDRLPGWKSTDEIFELCTVAAVSRPGYDKSEARKSEYGAKVRFVDMPGVDASSSQIRELVSKRRPIKYLLPEAVENYIIKNKLYSRAFDAETFIRGKFANITAEIKNMLSEHRYTHTLGVIELSNRLAAKYGADEDKTALAALVHDCAKHMPKDASHYVLHGVMGEEIAREKFGITDCDVLNAIHYHTTGRPGMSLLEKIILVADCIEPFRLYPEECAKIEAEAFSNLDKAMLSCLEIKINFTRKTGKKLDELSLEAYEYIKNNMKGE